MTTVQAFCKIWQSKVSADKMLSDDDLRRAMGRDDEVRVMHVFVGENSSSADHIWTLSIQETKNLCKYLRSRQG